MYKFVGYAIETPDEILQQQIILRRVDAEKLCNQNGIPLTCVIQLYRFVSPKKNAPMKVDEVVVDEVVVAENIDEKKEDKND